MSSGRRLPAEMSFGRLGASRGPSWAAQAESPCSRDGPRTRWEQRRQAWGPLVISFSLNRVRMWLHLLQILGEPGISWTSELLDLIAASDMPKSTNVHRKQVHKIHNLNYKMFFSHSKTFCIFLKKVCLFLNVFLFKRAFYYEIR